MKPFKVPPTDMEIESYVYEHTMQETSDNIREFINGMKEMRDLWMESVKINDGGQVITSLTDGELPWIYERDGNTVYRRRLGSKEREIV
jgi:hypothetical protein